MIISCVLGGLGVTPPTSVCCLWIAISIACQPYAELGTKIVIPRNALYRVCKKPLYISIKCFQKTRYNTKRQMHRASLAVTCRQGKTRYNNWRLQTIQAFQQFFICHRIVFRFNAGHISISKSVVHCPSLVFNISMGIDQCCFQI